MRKPTRLQIFIAQRWPEKIWFTGWPLFFVGVVIWKCRPLSSVFSDLGAFGAFAIALALAPVIGFFVAFIFASIVFPLVVYICECMNGGPFKVGDTVQILTGPYRGRVTRIYSTWQGCTFRVQLGLEEQKTYKDIFCSDQLLCEENSAVET